ncbi:hypothetical protein BSL78_21856 [Apostichopus japonicus]|uniref:Uncharacterized protein n=1 Tax=Stichopus japonicus TaxID=307972 RepID=A0A2G8JZY7_STIJA|nr:hypothetical protein BSL78_21856 [Apostichopus japonicus]
METVRLGVSAYRAGGPWFESRWRLKKTLKLRLIKIERVYFRVSNLPLHVTRNKMASHSDLVEKAVKVVLEDIAKYAPEEYKKLNAEPAKKEKIIQAARATATETLKLNDELRNQPEDISARLSKHLSDERIQLIRGGLEIPTFRLEIAKRDDEKHWLELTREGKQFLPSRAISTALDADWGSVMQLASILVEAILLVMSAVGISVSPSEREMEQAVNETAQAIRANSKLQRALDDFVAAWNSSGSAYSKATALFYLIKDSYAAGILWTIIKSLCSSMAWYEWLETAAKVTAMIVAALATEGVALIAEIALIVLSAVDFARKIANIIQLSEIKKTL